MKKEYTFTMSIDEQLREEFKMAASECHRSAACLLREMMREFVAQHKDERKKSKQ